jgi:hypothetical protein
VDNGIRRLDDLDGNTQGLCVRRKGEEWPTIIIQSDLDINRPESTPPPIGERPPLELIPCYLWVVLFIGLCRRWSTPSPYSTTPLYHFINLP